MKTDVDLKQALLDPASVFASPWSVRNHAELTKQQKVEILRRWEYEESEVSVAEEEGMVEGAPSVLDQVLAALEELVDEIDTEHSPPTKHRGI